MKISFWMVCLLATLLVISSAQSAPNNIQVNKYKTYQDNITAISDDGNTSLYIFGSAYDNSQSERSLSFDIRSISKNHEIDWQISCHYTSNDNELSITKVNGKHTLNLQATIDPTDPQCNSYNVLAPIVIDLSGKETDESKDASTGQGKSWDHGSFREYKYKSQWSSAEITGTFNSINLPWRGSFGTNRNIEHTKVK